MNFKELEKIILSDGWVFVAQKGSHCQYKHPFKSGKVTIPKHGKEEIHIQIAKSILKQAGITKIGASK